MKLPRNFRRLHKKEILQEGDWMRVERGLYVVLKYRNTPVCGGWIGERVGRAEAFRKRDL